MLVAEVDAEVGVDWEEDASAVVVAIVLCTGVPTAAGGVVAFFMTDMATISLKISFFVTGVAPEGSGCCESRERDDGCCCERDDGPCWCGCFGESFSPETILEAIAANITAPPSPLWGWLLLFTLVLLLVVVVVVVEECVCFFITKPSFLFAYACISDE